jgi:hypothetical protein
MSNPIRLIECVGCTLNVTSCVNAAKKIYCRILVDPHHSHYIEEGPKQVNGQMKPVLFPKLTFYQLRFLAQEANTRSCRPQAVHLPAGQITTRILHPDKTYMKLVTILTNEEDIDRLFSIAKNLEQIYKTGQTITCFTDGSYKETDASTTPEDTPNHMGFRWIIPPDEYHNQPIEFSGSAYMWPDSYKAELLGILTFCCYTPQDTTAIVYTDYAGIIADFQSIKSTGIENKRKILKKNCSAIWFSLWTIILA